MEIVVRRAVAEDAPSLARLRWRWQVEEWQKIPAIDQESFVDFFTSWTMDHLSRYAIFVVQVDGRLGGIDRLESGDPDIDFHTLPRRVQCVGNDLGRARIAGVPSEPGRTPRGGVFRRRESRAAAPQG